METAPDPRVTRLTQRLIQVFAEIENIRLNRGTQGMIGHPVPNLHRILNALDGLGYASPTATTAPLVEKLRRLCFNVPFNVHPWNEIAETVLDLMEQAQLCPYPFTMVPVSDPPSMVSDERISGRPHSCCPIPSDTQAPCPPNSGY